LSDWAFAGTAASALMATAMPIESILEVNMVSSPIII
jgi:hypothetical protein